MKELFFNIISYLFCFTLLIFFLICIPDFIFDNSSAPTE